MSVCESCGNSIATGWRYIQGKYICLECDKKERMTNYYKLPNGIEAKDVTGFFPGNLAIAINYVWRAGKKPGNSYQDDIQKAIDHLNFELERTKK